jgi:hypothetical protein
VIPAAFAVSIVIVRTLTNTGAGSVMDRMKQLSHP